MKSDDLTSVFVKRQTLRLNISNGRHFLLSKLRRIHRLMELHLRATGYHFPYGITQCYLPGCHPTSEHTPR